MVALCLDIICSPFSREMYIEVLFLREKRA